MRIPHQGCRIQLQGLQDDTSRCFKVSPQKLKGLLKRKAVTHFVQVKKVDVPEILTDHYSILEYVAVISDQLSFSDSIPPSIQNIIQQYSELFHEPSSLPPPREFDHSIPLLPGAQPVNVRPYKYAPHQKTEIEKQVDEMLSKGLIQKSVSSFASPVLLVRKKDGSWRFCVDYRQLNAITVKDKHPMLVVDELLDELHGSQWFTKLDCRSGYHKIRLTSGDEKKTAFKTHHGLYEFLVMPFGLTNAPATFQAAMNSIFSPLMRKGVLVFMDDILVYTPSLDSHCVLLQQVFEILQEHQFFLKLSKCEFAKQELEYLGHTISPAGVATEPSKVKAVSDWPIPQNVRDLRGFLGLTGYYRRFIQHYAMISRPLTNLLKKGVQFQWTPAHEAFSLLKAALIQAPVLAVPDFQKPFVVETDACDLGIGAVLMQEGHPISYLSKPLSARNQALSTYEKECMAILLAIEKWRPYLLAQEFLIRTDHKSLLYLTEQKATTKL